MDSTNNGNRTIKAIEGDSVHKITSGQVVIDLQTAVKELVENSLDAGATNVEVRFNDYGMKSIQVIDNGCGISPQDYPSIALKHHTSKLSSFSDLSAVQTFGFRGEALSSLCALCDSVTVTTARKEEEPMGVSLELDSGGNIKGTNKVARQRGTTVTLTNLFKPLPVRRKELERNAKREFGKALALLNAYALGPCCVEGTHGKGIRLTVTNQIENGRKLPLIRTPGTPTTRASVSALWGPKSLDGIVDLDLTFVVERDKHAIRRMDGIDGANLAVGDTKVLVKGLVSKFVIGCGRTGTDRQFFYVNGRPCTLPKVQKAFNEVYRSFNANQAPFIIADFVVPTASCDINVSPDKRTIFLHSEGNLIAALKAALEEHFAPSRSTFDVGGSQSRLTQKTLSNPSPRTLPTPKANQKEVVESEEEDELANADDKSPSDSDGKANSHKRTRSSPTTSSPTSHLSHRINTSQESPDTSYTKQGAHTQEECIDEVVLRQQTTASESRTSGRPSSLRNSPGNSSGSLSLVSDLSSSSVSCTQSRSRDKGDDDPMILDTTGAVWNRKKSRQIQPSEAEVDEELAESNKEQPPRKKIRLTDDGASEKVAASNTPVRSNTSAKRRGGTSSNETTSRLTMRSSLSVFARSGSQIPNLDIDDIRDEEQEEQEASHDKGDLETDPRILDSPLIGRKSEGLDTKMDTPIHEDDASGCSGKVIDLTDDDCQRNPLLDLDETELSGPSSQVILSRPEVIRSLDSNSQDVRLRFDLPRLAVRWKQSRTVTSEITGVQSNPNAKLSEDASVSNTDDLEKAADALARIIEKEDFGSMDIVGQFNLGFIVTRRRKANEDGNGDMDDLFIVDQHAADEKYNFEDLQQTTIINSQKLFRPQPLELTAADELLAIENIHVLRQNGFEIHVDEDSEVASGPRLKLLAQPVSKSTVFDMKDLEEIIHLMQDRPAGQMVRCSKARAMFAMRACRKSVMIGMPLTRKQMASVVRHMGTMDQPWNCPHGRPTMRHLSDMTAIRSTQNCPREIDWSSMPAI